MLFPSVKMKNAGLLFVAVAALFIASCGGGEPKQEAQPFSADGNAVAKTPTGEDVYKRVCASCHMAGGDGIANVYPPLAKSDYIADKEQAIRQVIKGSSGEIIVNGKKYNNTMPPQQLNDDEVAAVLSYVYTNMGNNGSVISADEVKAIRAKM